ncbi:VOC family protein [Streptomyces cyaneochromogenes]|uniref:VOC family protein n=1 Tax=Streptomyces cyaneochromogenes TaxID=2496836 RepID=A0A3Q9EP60_9ACTN|nr:VOC family protein [Streptomyces cyaneochromogenes]AZQ32901.1 VOC family protein [Streptomyces cyaneochromogenes]
MARLHDIVIDRARPAATARFWAAALDDYAAAPYDDAELARLRAQGIDAPEDDPTVPVEPRIRGPRLWCQLVPEPKRAKNRLHLDLPSPTPETEPDRLTALGGTVLARHDDHWLLADPEGNEYCLLPAPP